MYAVLADIIEGKTATADVFFLIAVILFALDFVTKLIPGQQTIEKYSGVLTAGGLTFVALGLLVL